MSKTAFHVILCLDSSGSDTYEPDISGKVKEKRNAHTAAEQKRRDAIKVLYFSARVYITKISPLSYCIV